MKKIILKVNGMMCTGCENRIKNAVGNIDGVKSVIADHITGKVTVITDNDLSKEVIKEALEDIGYEVVGEQ